MSLREISRVNMSEDQGVEVSKTDIAALRHQVRPVWNSVTQDLIESGIQPGTSSFRRARHSFTRKEFLLRASGETDEGTGLYNRRGLKSRVAETLEQFQRLREDARKAGADISTTLTVVMLDANGLK